MDRSAFFDVMRSEFGSLSQSQVDGTEALLDAAEARTLPMNQLAYVLSTSWHETDATMMPIEEYGKGEGKEYGEPCPQYDNQVAYGRGYVQLTWDYNYEKADSECQLNGALLADFDLALDPKIASDIIYRGMLEGWFTGKKLGDYVNDQVTDYYNARRVVNGTDKADLLADYAESYEQALRAADYHLPPEPVEPPTEGVVPPEEGEHPPQPIPPTPPEPKVLYTYKVTELGEYGDDEDSTLESYLNEQGARGWRMVHMGDEIIMERLRR